ncbi:transcriptional protein SWT1 isoform X2 [Periophthalmus magnuspinnatus]|uniref:transcriptional protein SWT1 isoform X2 n=1 Tax=Periophthalmus magnuspinnatus TaxID=409849 RepID=UPI00243720D0|nr:transcriptional protein SWT1 isoform X2 [Periophthalmus magnuspinnatus]
MSKKSKKRKHRRHSTSSSEDDYAKTSTSKTERAKRKCSRPHSKERNDVPAHRTKDDRRSRKDEAESKRQIKKPVSTLENARSTRRERERRESPIFKDEESKKSKNPERKSSKDSSHKSSSQDKLIAQKRNIFTPRSVSVAQKVQGQTESSRKRRWDVLPTTSEAKMPLLVPKDTTTLVKNEPEKQKYAQPQQDDLKTKLKSQIFGVATSKATTTTAKTSHKTTYVLPEQQCKILKPTPIVLDQPFSKTTVVAEKLVKDHRISLSSSSKTKRQVSNQNVTKHDSKSSFCNSFLPVDPSPSQTPNLLLNFKIPAISATTVVESKLAKDKNKTISIKSDDKALPVHRADQLPCKTTTKTTTETATAAKSSIKTSTEVSRAQQRKTPKETSIVPSLPPPGRLNFKIPKKTIVAETSIKDNVTLPIQRDRTSSKSASSVMKQSTHSSTSMAISAIQNVQNQDPWPSAANTFSSHVDPSPWQDEMQVAEGLHQARSEKLLEVDVMQSYGELTCMEIDPPEEGATHTKCKPLPQQDMIIVLDTNILLSHLDYVKKIVTRGLKGVGIPVVLIPWVVLQELDSLKKGRGLSGSVAHLAIPAISYICNCLKGKESHLRGQSMQQAADSTNGLNAENNDDRVLQCCLQYQRLHPECAVILCTNDKNLCSKALLSGVQAFSKNDLEFEVARSSVGFPFLQNVQISTPAQPHRHSISTLAPGNIHAQAQDVHSQESTGLSVKKDNKQLSKNTDARRRSCHLSGLVCEFESCLQEALSDVLEAEMKAAFSDLWQEIVYIKPPWSLNDVLQCLNKHWIAVFGLVVPRAKQQNVQNLMKFFSGKDVDQNSTLAALLDAKDLLKEFLKSSSRVPGSISVVNNILNSLQPQGEAAADDVVMNEAEEDKRPASPQVSPSEVWALFENIWEHVFQARPCVSVLLQPECVQSSGL